MVNEDNVLGLTKYNSLNYEHLSGNKEGLSSVRVMINIGLSLKKK